MTSKKTTVFNPSSSPVVYTMDGRTLGGGERCEVNAVDAVGQGLLDTDALLDVTPAEETREAPAKKAAPTRPGAPDQEDHA